ncbi:hypothetical protein IGB42_00947 [Andreprevotia sp. IGB-42]|uniref:DUF4124 domain-containing protein n=1 Tax=Andreprevotia sp. IGB-42 TaxID=2497473 RepID=UPI00135B958E|nr:DUF4124 domain-containing protein [Andreprevotia sp. IGB-42]KAF0814891.1 hypothetical protein IGB42_00947 [Andreprevotia sp. IGB-42]
MRVMTIVFSLICCVLLMMASQAQAAGYKCKDKAGKVTFTDQPCESMDQTGQKIVERGAGYSNLTEREKDEFIDGFMQSCRNGVIERGIHPDKATAACLCIGEELANTAKYEDLRLATTKRRLPPQLEQAQDAAAQTCRKKLQAKPVRPEGSSEGKKVGA